MSIRLSFCYRKHGCGAAAVHHSLLSFVSTRASAIQGRREELRATIAELVTATETAERAIAGLKTTMREAEQTLGDRLHRRGEILRRD